MRNVIKQSSNNSDRVKYTISRNGVVHVKASDLLSSPKVQDIIRESSKVKISAKLK